MREFYELIMHNLGTRPSLVIQHLKDSAPLLSRRKQTTKRTVKNDTISIINLVLTIDGFNMSALYQLTQGTCNFKPSIAALRKSITKSCKRQFPQLYVSTRENKNIIFPRTPILTSHFKIFTQNITSQGSPLCHGPKEWELLWRNYYFSNKTK